ncbi:hypothetical protein [Mycobacterium uberis]|uniref:hypothetical protein n=1 Tax=Mycobacterium uberis TaxID=2162698 RepID=UPI00105871F5|nr:hypothetical protein [Mycobacterium uberis]
MTNTATLVGIYFDNAKIDDFFCIALEVFNSPDSNRELKLPIFPDNKAAQIIITHDRYPASAESISHVDAELKAMYESCEENPAGKRQILY